MDSLSFKFQPVITSNLDSFRQSKFHSRGLTIGAPNVINSRLNNRRSISVHSISNRKSEEKEEGMVEEVRVPDAWLNSSKALEVISLILINLSDSVTFLYIDNMCISYISSILSRILYYCIHIHIAIIG